MIHSAIILWFIMLAIVVAHMVPVSAPRGYGKLLVWLVLVLLTVVLVLLHAVSFRG